MEGKSSSGFSSPKAFYRNSQAQKSGERMSVISRNRPPSFKRAKRVTFSLSGPFIMPDRFVLPYGNGLWIVSKKTTVRSISFIGKEAPVKKWKRRDTGNSVIRDSANYSNNSMAIRASHVVFTSSLTFQFIPIFSLRSWLKNCLNR